MRWFACGSLVLLFGIAIQLRAAGPDVLVGHWKLTKSILDGKETPTQEELEITFAAQRVFIRDISHNRLRQKERKYRLDGKPSQNEMFEGKKFSRWQNDTLVAETHFTLGFGTSTIMETWSVLPDGTLQNLFQGHNLPICKGCDPQNPPKTFTLSDLRIQATYIRVR